MPSSTTNSRINTVLEAVVWLVLMPASLTAALMTLYWVAAGPAQLGETTAVTIAISLLWSVLLSMLSTILFVDEDIERAMQLGHRKLDFLWIMSLGICLAVIALYAFAIS